MRREKPAGLDAPGSDEARVIDMKSQELHRGRLIDHIGLVVRGSASVRITY